MPWQIEIGSSFLFHCGFVDMLPMECAFSHAELPNLAGFLGLQLKNFKMDHPWTPLFPSTSRFNQTSNPDNFVS